jgi:V/A-type H+/Na+-transporting ATPase subunit I
MAVLSMQKIRLYVHRDNASEVLRAIQKVGVVQFEEVTVGAEVLTLREKEAFEFDYVSSRLDFAVRFLSRFEEPAKGFRAMIEGKKVRTSGTALYETVRTFDYNIVIDASQDIERGIVEAETRIAELEEERALLTPWEDFSRTLASGRETASTTMLFVEAGDVATHESLALRCAEQSIPFHEVSASPTHRAYVLMRTDKDAFTVLLHERKMECVVLPLRRGTPKEELERISRAIQSQLEDIETLEERARALARANISNLRIVSDYMLWQKEKYNLLSTARSSTEVLVFEGWCPKPDMALLESRIRNKTEEYALEQVTPTEHEIPPVEIRNHAFFRPFEAVTRLYGLPGHTEMDPTAYLAGFFFLFFGLALSDLGYGLVMALGIGVILWRYHVPKAIAPMLWLMWAGGVSTVLVGIIYGGYFGLSMELLPGWVQALQLFDPIQNPMPVFYLALAFGVIQIIAGLVLHIISEARNGRCMQGLLRKGPWIGLFVFGCAWLGASLSLIPGALEVYQYAVYACLALIAGVGMYLEEKFLLKPVMGLLALYESIAYLSDILSYSRLLALGLATSALAYAVNLIALMVKDVPYVGLILMASILVIGHLFSLALNILGAFIHSARLQFVEFFGKFIEGSGRMYTPFKRHERFVELIDSTGGD